MAEDRTSQRPLSLAHLSLIETAPDRLIPIAQEAGFDLVDLRLSPATPTDRVYGSGELAALCRQLTPLLKETGLRVWDVEIIRIHDRTRPDDYLGLMEAAASLGARRIKIVCDSEDAGLATGILARLCRLAAPFGLTLDLEYMVFSGVKSLGQAVALVRAADQPNLKVLVDALHWIRAGDTAEELRSVGDGVLGYVQLCDGPKDAPRSQGEGGREALIREARTSRLVPGRGEFPLAELLACMPAGCVASVEVPLPAGRDPLAHARDLYRSARALVDACDGVRS